MRFVCRAVLVAAMVVCFPFGCGDVEDEDFGLVIAEWSIGGSLDPDACARNGAELFEAVVFERGEFVAEIEEPCEAFSASFDLREGTYLVNTRLITKAQEAVSDTLVFEEVLVEKDVGAVLHADFPDEPSP